MAFDYAQEAGARSWRTGLERAGLPDPTHLAFGEPGAKNVAEKNLSAPIQGVGGLQPPSVNAHGFGPDQSCSVEPS